MTRYLDRKSFVTTLGAAGLGLGLTAATLGRTPSVMAQAQDALTEEGPAGEFVDFREKKIELYNAFTAALAEELGIASADEVDGAIRIAMMAVIDDQVSDSDEGLTAGQAEAMKSLVASSDVPFGALAMGAGPKMFVTRGRGGPGSGMHGHHDGFGGGMGRRRTTAWREDDRGEEGDDTTAKD